MTEYSASGRIMLTGMSPEGFVSPTDRAALQNLQRLPGLPLVLRKFNELALDRMLYAQNSAESVRCGPRQFPTLHHLLREACSVLDMPEPELYVRYSEHYNAYTAGVNRTFITLHSALLDGLTDEELLYVLGHELGHIKCGHVLYSMLARFLIPLLDALGQATLGVGRLAGMGLVSAFYEWMRQAEFTCDRAGLLTCQRPRTAFTTTMKLGCGSSRFDQEMNVDAFLEQARSHAETNGLDGAAKALMFLLYTWQLDHPQVVFRAKQLDDWIRGGAYERILSGDYVRNGGGRPVEEAV
jgi:Zn-dependent protease with chaperone function